MTERRLVAIVPAWNEADAIGKVVDEIKGFDPTIDVVVIDDGSTDYTMKVAESHGATVLGLPFNVGIGGAVQTGFRYALEHRYELAVRLDGDGQHDASEIPKILGQIEAGEADLVIGSRFVDPGGTYRPPFARRIGIRIFARLVSSSLRPARDRHDVGLRRARPSRNRALRRAVPTRLPGGRGDARRVAERLAGRAGAGRHARANDRFVLDHVRPVSVLHHQGHARVARSKPAAISAPRRGATVTPVRVSIVGVVASVLLILVVLELVRGRRLKERYALLWLATGVVLLVLSAWREGLNTLAGWRASRAIRRLCSLRSRRLLLLVLLHYSTVISKLTDENADLAQRTPCSRNAW